MIIQSLDCQAESSDILLTTEVILQKIKSPKKTPDLDVKFREFEDFNNNINVKEETKRSVEEDDYSYSSENEAKSNKSPTSLESENNILNNDEEDGDGHLSESEEATITIDISELKETEFEDRTVLNQKVKECGKKQDKVKF